MFVPAFFHVFLWLFYLLAFAISLLYDLVLCEFQDMTSFFAVFASLSCGICVISCFPVKEACPLSNLCVLPLVTFFLSVLSHICITTLLM